MEEKSIPYIAHEAALAREERTIKRLWILCIIIFLAFVTSNAGWIYYESQYEGVTAITQDAVTEDSPIYMNGTGEMAVNGQSETDDH